MGKPGFPTPPPAGGSGRAAPSQEQPYVHRGLVRRSRMDGWRDAGKLRLPASPPFPPAGARRGTRNEWNGSWRDAGPRRMFGGASPLTQRNLVLRWRGPGRRSHKTNEKRVSIHISSGSADSLPAETRRGLLDLARRRVGYPRGEQLQLCPGLSQFWVE